MRKNSFIIAAFSLLMVPGLAQAFSGEAVLTSLDDGPVFQPAYAAYYEYLHHGQKHVTVLIADYPDVCASLQRFELRANSNVVELRIGDTNTGRHVLTSTMQTLRPDPGEAKIMAAQLGDDCKMKKTDKLFADYGMDGATTLRNSPGGRQLEGSFAATFGLQKPSVVKGSFSAMRCEMPYDPAPAEFECK